MQLLEPAGLDRHVQVGAERQDNFVAMDIWDVSGMYYHSHSAVGIVQVLGVDVGMHSSVDFDGLRHQPSADCLDVRMGPATGPQLSRQERVKGVWGVLEGLMWPNHMQQHGSPEITLPWGHVWRHQNLDYPSGTTP